MANLVNADDAGDAYVADREQAQADEYVRQFLARTAPEPKPDQTQPGAQPEAQPAQQPGQGQSLELPRDVARGESALSTVGSVASDVARGIVEAPRQALGGVSDFVHNVFTASDHLAEWLNENVADLKVPIPKTGIESVDQLLANPAKAIAGQKNEVPKGKSVTGGVVREAVRFLTGFNLAGGGGTSGFAAIPAGAISDFVGQDPDAKRLADLWKQAGLPENELTSFLESDPTDTELEKRFKNALEGMGVGALSEGLFRGAKFLRAKWQARRAGQQAGLEHADQLAAQPRVEPKDLEMLGDTSPKAPLVSIEKKMGKAVATTETGVPESVTAKGIAKSARAGKVAAKETIGEPAVTINFARMDTPDNIKQVFKDTAEAFSGSIDEARRGRITLAETRKMADKLGMEPADLINRTKGQAYNAEQIKAAGIIMDSATEKLFQIAEKAASPNASAVDLYMLRKMLAVHQAIQGEFLGAVAEAGRALNAIKIAQQGGSAQMARSIQSIVDGTGGVEVGQALAQRLVMLKAAGASEGAISQFARKTALAQSMDVVKEAWVNALLSNPTTHIVNAASNSLVAAMQVYERRVGELVSQAMGRDTGQGIAVGESAAMLHGLKEGWRDAFRMAWKSLRTGESEMSPMLGKMDLPHGQFSHGAQNAISSRAFGLDEAGTAGRVVDFIGAGVRSPGRALTTSDEFFKSIGYRMELHAQAFRQAASEGLQGEELGRRMAQIMSDPPEAVRMAAADAALYNTFTNSTGWFGKAMMALRAGGGSANPITFIMPFVRTPVNIARYAFERTPLAPLVGQWRADIAAGGARADLALARMGTGTAIMLLTSDLAMSGQVSGRGPKEPGQREALRRQGWQPYSIKVGNKWYSYNRADPFGMTMGFAADFTDALRQGEIAPEDADAWNQVMASMIAAVAQVSISKTYLSGMSEFFNAMSDPTRYGPNWVNRFMGSFVPSGVAATKRLVDPVTREAWDPYQAIASRIPGLSEKLTPKRDLWGEKVQPHSGLGPVYDTFSPVYASEVRDSPVDREIVRLGADIRRIPKKATFDGVDVNFHDWPKVYDEYVRLAGNELKHPAWGLGAKDFLDAVVTGKHPMSEVYKMQSDGKDGGKSEFIRDTVRSYRNFAAQKIMDDPRFVDFHKFIAERKVQKQQRSMPEGVMVPGGIKLP